MFQKGNVEINKTHWNVSFVNLIQTRKQERQNWNGHLEGSVVDDRDYDQDVSHLWNNNVFFDLSVGVLTF